MCNRALFFFNLSVSFFRICKCPKRVRNDTALLHEDCPMPIFWSIALYFCLLASKSQRTRAVVQVVLSLLKLSRCVLFHWNGMAALRSCLKGASICLMFGLNLQMYCSNPNNLRTTSLLVSAGMLHIARIFSGSGLMPSELIICNMHGTDVLRTLQIGLGHSLDYCLKNIPAQKIAMIANVPLIPSSIWSIMRC